MRTIAWVLLLLPGISLADEQLWSLLERGGQTVLLRHTATAPGTGHPPAMRLDDCSTQRNLSEQGRAHAQRIGERFRGRGIPVDRVLSSPWCRCLETARLAFGKAEISQALGNLFGRQENLESQVRQMRVIVGRGSGKGNWILVTHGSTIAALTGVSPATGEMVIVAPDAKVLGRLISD